MSASSSTRWCHRWRGCDRGSAYKYSGQLSLARRARASICFRARAAAGNRADCSGCYDRETGTRRSAAAWIVHRASVVYINIHITHRVVPFPDIHIAYPRRSLCTVHSWEVELVFFFLSFFMLIIIRGRENGLLANGTRAVKNYFYRDVYIWKYGAIRYDRWRLNLYPLSRGETDLKKYVFTVRMWMGMNELRGRYIKSDRSVVLIINRSSIEEKWALCV